MPEIIRDTLLRIVLAIGPISPCNFPDHEDLEQIGATFDMLMVADVDRKYISDLYNENKGRKIGRHTLSYTAAAILARLEWMAELLGVEMPVKERESSPTGLHWPEEPEGENVDG